MSAVIKDAQKRAFQQLIHNTIPSIIESASCDLNEEYRVIFKPMEASNSILVRDESGTDYYSIKAAATLQNKITNEFVEFNVELLRVPALQELGFRIKGNYMQQLDIYDRAKGWNFFEDRTKGDIAMVLSENSRSLTFTLTKKAGPCVIFKIHGEHKTKVKMSTFLRAITGYSNEELISIFGYNNPFIIQAFGKYTDDSSIYSSISTVYKAVMNDDGRVQSTALSMKKAIDDNLFSARYFALGAGNSTRLNYLQSFGYRASGKALARDIDCNGYHFDAGMVLGNAELQILDMLPITELVVEHENKLYNLHKFSNFTFNVLGCKIAQNVPELGIRSGKVLDKEDVISLNNSELNSITLEGNKVVVRRKYAYTLSIDDIFTAFNIWADNLNGYGKYLKQFEVTNRVIVPFDKSIAGYISVGLATVIGNLKHNLNGMDYRGKISLGINNCYKDITPSVFIDMVANPENSSGQMADMCNILSFVSKSHKATANLGANSATPEMVNVQDLQEGRFDPLDVPESDKIGRVHYRTMYAKLDDNGNVTAPYIRVVNGEVVNKDPVYLTAMEESGEYIAEWNETFKNPDGTKKSRVRTRCNGNVQSVETNRVNYKEYSPYQNLSPAHAMTPFPGHSNGKRITMECNQVKQAVPLVNRDRPSCASGGESLLRIGYYTASDVLTEYYEANKFLITEDKATVLSSGLKLVGIKTEKEERELTFEVLQVKSGSNIASLRVPYVLRTFEASMFSYDINPVKGNVYYGEDVVVLNNGYSLEKKDVVLCADFGAQDVDTSIFDKGIALTKELRVVYKTFEGSAIEDGIVISDKLVHDDSLTHIGLFEIKDTIPKDRENTEFFCEFSTSEDTNYMNSNGLPVVGTYLSPGMPAIKKAHVSNGKKSVRVIDCPRYVEGQVISATIEETVKGLEAKVIVAQRSYIQSGDKMAGRCGNKGVTARIVPETDMPFVAETGEVADVILNPLGIPSRQNITQLLEHLLSYVMHTQDKIAIVTPYNPNDVDFVRKLGREFGVEPKIMIDGRTGQEFARPINFGILPMYKLQHVSKRKIHAVGMDAKLDSTFLQPMKGSKANGGQSVGEMETWCLESVGATALLNEFFTIQSDDAVGRNDAISRMHNNEDCYSFDGINNNDYAMQACYRSLGVEFTSNSDENYYSFEPIKDEVIRSFYPSPITNRSMLHASSIFGATRNVQDKTIGRTKWGWIDLHTKMVLPIWFYKGGINTIFGIGATDFISILNGNICVRIKNGRLEFNEPAYMTDSSEWYTGMSGIVKLFEEFDTKAAELGAKVALEAHRSKSKNQDVISDKEQKLIKRYNMLHSLNQSNVSLKDYVVTAFPVMPQTYRPEIMTGGRNTKPDFDWHYEQIIRTAAEVEKDENQSTVMALYKAILEFSGLDSNVQNKKYKSILKFFCAKDQKSHHGKIRENMQSKRVMCSGRAAIKPAEDTTRTPLEMGVPFTMLVTMYGDMLLGYFNQLSDGATLDKKRFFKLMMYVSQRNKPQFYKVWEKYFAKLFSFTGDAYEEVTAHTKSFLEGRDGNAQQCVTLGRQPSLHKYSIRSFKPYVVYDNMIHLHPLLCKGYNADFDGDQMWVIAVLSVEARNQAFDKLSPSKDFILPKNGAVVLEHSQDIVLGVYCATMLRDNAAEFSGDISSARYYDSIETIFTDYKAGNITPWDLVVYNRDTDKYISTAGRIMFNSLLFDGFTKDNFTNPLGLKGIKPELYKELKCDGIVGSGSAGGDGAIRYYNLPSLCKQIFDEVGSPAIAVYQAITEFGFLVSDKTAVSLSLYDFDIPNDKAAMLAEAEQIKNAIEEDYQNGLISEKDKRDAVISVYGDPKTGANAKIMKDLLNNLPRNNNIFIMMDSGARGNKSQLMHMCGAIGILQKSKTEDLETSVTTNYYQGLSSFDVHLASYSARTGVASTQNETKSAGYATHKVVYMASGIKIVENNCKPENTDYHIEWGERNESKDRFLPTKEWYDAHLLGKKANPNDSETLSFTENGIFTDAAYNKLVVANGFHNLELVDDSLVADIFNAKNSIVLDENSKKLVGRVTKGNKLTFQAIEALLRQKVGTVVTDDGTYSIRYDMSACCRSMLTKRIAYNLPGLKTVLNKATNEHLTIITDDTLDAIEDMKMDVIQARTVLRCNSKNGICAHCFGLQFSDGQLPEVGSYVGTESAQSIAEPASQLTMNVINKGGVAGASSVSSGVEIFDSLLDGGPSTKRMDAKVAPRSGYVNIRHADNMATVCVVPESEDCGLCGQCREANGVSECPLKSGKTAKYLCALDKKVMNSTLVHHNNEFVYAGDALTHEMVHPDSVVAIKEPYSIEDLRFRKQMIWIANYYNTFKDSGISIYARHFELIANVQMKYVKIIDSKVPGIEIGRTYEFNEVRDNLESLRIKHMVSPRSEVTLLNSGAFAALSFENVSDVAAKLVISGHKEYANKNHSLIGSLAIGEDMKSSNIKILHKPSFIKTSKVSDDSKVIRPAAFEFVMEDTTDSGISFADLDISVLAQELDTKVADAFAEPVAMTKAQVSPEIETFELDAFDPIVPESKSIQVVERKPTADDFALDSDFAEESNTYSNNIETEMKEIDVSVTKANAF